MSVVFPHSGLASLVACAVAVAASSAAAEPGAAHSALSLDVPAARFVTLGPPAAAVNEVVAHPADGRLLYLSAPGGGAGYRLYRSLDGGATWDAPQVGLPYQRLPDGGRAVSSQVVVDPRHVGVAYWIVRHGERVVADPRLYVFRTEDHGASWSELHQQFDLFGFAGAFELFFPPSRPRTSWARNTGTGSTRLFRSRDLGRNWFEQPDLEAIPESALEPSPPLVRYRAVTGTNTVERSDDGGGSWRTTGPAPYHPVAITAVVGGAPDGRVYAATSDRVAQFPAAGVFRSDDSGDTWTPANSGLTDLRVESLAAALDTSGAVWAATPSGLFRSNDGGESWQGPGSSAGGAVRDVALVPVDGGAALIAGALRSTDGGASWQLVPELAPSGSDAPAAFGFAAVSGTAVVFALVPQSEGDDGGSLLRSDDGGATWIAPGGAAKTSCGAIAATAAREEPVARPAELFCLETSGSPPEVVVRRSGDGGASFVEVHRSAALAPGTLAPVTVVDLAVGGGAAGAEGDGEAVLLAVANVGAENVPGAPLLRVSEDGGATWQAKAVSDQGLWVHDALVAEGGEHLLLASSAGVLASTDGGATWGTAHRGLELAGPLQALGEGAFSGELFAGATQSLYRSGNAGATWQRFDDGARGAAVHSITFDDPSGVLALATSHGVLARRLAGASCEPAATALCLRGGAFRVELAWEGLGAGVGAGHAVPITSDTGSFWFFEPGNVELVVKVLDGCALNGRHWVFVTGLTDVATDLRVTRVADGASRQYRRVIGQRFLPVLDVEAFACQ